MIYKWRLKHVCFEESNQHSDLLLANLKIQEGEVEADTQKEAMRILNEERNIQPHTGEILEIKEPS